jgi:NAD(P)H dehydrogenase (quinone)
MDHAGGCGWSHLLNRPIEYEERSPEQQRAALIGIGLSDFVAGLLLGLDRLFQDSALAEITSTVHQLTGCAPRSLPQWLGENISVFQN